MTRYEIIQSEDGLWTVGLRLPIDRWDPESDYGSPEEAQKRADWLNGPINAGMVYRRSEDDLWTTGFLGPAGDWWPATDWADKEDAARHVADNNGSDVIWPGTGRPL